MRTPHWSVNRSTGCLIMLMLVGLPNVSWAQTCVSFTPCSEVQGQHQLRARSSSETWDLYAIPASADSFIYLTANDYRTHVQSVMSAYSSLALAVPYDQVDPNLGGSGNFQWGWVSAADLRRDPNRRETAGIPLAATGTNTTNCKITTAIVKFARDPNDGVQHYAWTGEWCNPTWCNTPLTGTRVFDFKSAAMHEYGHALGLAHSTTLNATMYPSLAPQDTVARTLLGCEANAVVQGYKDDNPVAVIPGLSVVRVDGNVVVSWEALLQGLTAKYYLEYAPTWNEPFTWLTDVPVSQAGQYQVTIPSGPSGVYQLQEVGVHGDTIKHWADRDVLPGAVAEFSLPTINVDSLRTLWFGQLIRPASMTSSPTDYFVYCPAEFTCPAQALVDAWSYVGVQGRVVTLQSVGGVAGAKAHNASFQFPVWSLLIGSIWEGVDVYGNQVRGNPAYYQNNGYSPDPYAAQTWRDKVRTKYRIDLTPQPISVLYFTPFHPEPAWIADHDNDGLVDANRYHGWIPAVDTTEAWAYVSKIIPRIFQSATPPANYAQPVSFWTFAVDNGGNNGAYAKTMADELSALVGQLNPFVSQQSLLTDASHPTTVAQRNQMARADLNQAPSLIVGTSTVSGSTSLGGWPSIYLPPTFYSPDNYFDVNQLTPHGYTAFGLFDCAAAGEDRNLNIVSSIAKLLELVPNCGLYGLFAPVRGSQTASNKRIKQAFLEHQFSGPPGQLPPTIGENATHALHAVANVPLDLVVARTYALIGDPRLRIPNPGPSVVGVDSLSLARPLTILPNPSRGQASFSFALATPAMVELSIYDVGGRRISSLMPASRRHGPQLVRWNGQSDTGHDVRSGIYWARLTVGSEVTRHKLVFLR